MTFVVQTKICKSLPYGNLPASFLLLHNLFEETLKSKIDGIDIFKLDRELVDWIKIHYDDYFESAYIEIEELIAKDA